MNRQTPIQTQAKGALLIIDEVISFRAAIGGMASRYRVTPDIMTLGKIIGGGFPAGAIGGSQQVLQPFAPLGSGALSWGGTFSANPVTMSVGRASLELFDVNVIAELNMAGDALRTQLNEAGVGASGFGSLLRLSLRSDDDWWNLYGRGLLVCPNGLVALSTAMTNDDLKQIGHIIIETLGTTVSRT